MSIQLLATTEHFDIEWWPGVYDNGGLYIFSKNKDRTSSESESSRMKAQAFIARPYVPELITELRTSTGSANLLNRVPHEGAVPSVQRRPKKEGGVPGKAYYTPLTLKTTEEQRELADALEFACSKENVAQAEARNSSWGDEVLNGDYLENGVWASTLKWKMPAWGAYVELPPYGPAQERKQRFWAPRHQGSGVAKLTCARGQHRCTRGADPATRRSQPCLKFVWIKPGEYYLERKLRSSTERYHLQCAFRSDVIPTNWLNPHFEQYYVLKEQGFQGWVETERQKREGYDDETFVVPSDPERVRAFIGQVQDGYELDSDERKEWREHLRDTPVDLEPYATARQLVGLPNTLFELLTGGHFTD